MQRVPSDNAGSSDAADTYVADLHIHSRFSRACSRDLTLPNLAWWARRKGIALLGTGDFTHPAWFDHLRESLVDDANGLFSLKADEATEVTRRLPGSLQATRAAKFMLSVEISTIYKRDDRTRKVHHLIYMPDFAAATKFNTALGRIGNLTADGRPILGLDSRDLLEITLDAGGYLIPAHIWTPWFSALGSKSGFDAIADCYADLADHVTAVETGLSSDPAMNWRVSSLDRYRLVSNSDAHSPAALAREATLFTGEPDYAAVRDGRNLAGTLEFFPEEGKYHADGHRACGVNWEPQRTRDAGGRCPECGKPLTVGVLSRVEDLADRPEQFVREGQHVEHLIQLHEVLGEINGVGPKSKTVEAQLNHLVATLGAELDILRKVPLDEIGQAGGDDLREAITRLRRGTVRRIPGYDGEYGVITLFEPGELRNKTTAPQVETLFDIPAFDVPQQRKPERSAKPSKAAKEAKNAAEQKPPPLPAPVSPHEPFEPMLAGMEEVGTGLLDRLDAMQRVAASAPGGPLLIVAGPGTGKTRTLTHRIAYLCAELGVFAHRCLAITFTRRAAAELKERLDTLLGDVAEDITVGTFHSIGLSILKDNAKAAGLGANWRIADDHEVAEARDQAGDDDLSYQKLLRQQDLVDLDDLIELPVQILREEPALVEKYRKQWQWIFVDEYQDVDDVQYELLRLLSPADGNLCAIGDPDQAIYSFRGADVKYFLRFNEDFVDARLVRLTRNYRSSAPILAAAVQAITPSSLVSGRRLDPARLDPEAPLVGRYSAGSVADEADFVVRTVDELVGGLSHRSLDSGRVDSRATAMGALSFSDIAVLYRTDAQSGPIMEALSRAGVPVQKRSHNRLRDRAGVQVIARELRHARGLSGSLAARVKLTAQVLAQRFAAPTLDSEQLSPEDIWTAADLLMPLAHRTGDDLPALLQAIETGAEVDALDPRAEAVNMLTLHAAKGLEFPVVFLVGCEDGLLPLRWPGSRSSDDEIAEERRLFFVGLTRAQDRLYVSHSARRFRHGSEREQSPTPFLDAIDSGLFERLGDTVPARPKDRQLRLL
ncbi:UvrD-helicase domain-containing protein [Paractinoplanes ferrugineus]|uniref:DNA 3'-5' helicase n=1 Tax=Paractinoplanes ferrugineus TaxID=113564 RepID=A0A919J198_9ACTN|nr:UvrD-helicase domain-containing protein [Actinoplanes ferrugineus]GIE11864.1 DNA helicase [Actinoplanes ferrugineus]